jgi:hypothetical protein
VAEKIPRNPGLFLKILKRTKVLERCLTRVIQRNTEINKTIPNYTEKESVGILGTTLGNAVSQEMA